MPVSRVFEICNAYESGYGHGVNHDGLNSGPFVDDELNEAYEIGYNAGFAAIDDIDKEAREIHG